MTNNIMEPKIEIILLKFEQAEEYIWNEILSFVEEWNKTKEYKFINDEKSELVIYFPDEAHEELNELEYILDKQHQEREWIWMKTITNNPSKEDIEDHDYIQIIGDGYPDEFFLNESDSLSPNMTCEKCGTTHPHLRMQRNALKVNEDFLKKDIYPNHKFSPPGIDLINMLNGALLISNKVKTLLTDIKDLKGYTLLEVIDQHGKISDNLFQLKAEKIILLPDNLVNEGAICPSCGSVLSTMTKPFAVKKERLKESSFFSRSASGLSSIYIVKSLYQVFVSEKVRGLTPVQGADLMND